MGPPQNVHAQAETDGIGYFPQIEVQPVGVQPLAPDQPPFPEALPVAQPEPKCHTKWAGVCGVRHWGLSFNVGIPDGAGIDFIWHPARWARWQVGATYNTLNFGAHGGITVVPLGWGPSLTAEAGHSFNGSVNSVYGTHEAVLGAVGYSYADLHAGLEFGRNRFTFFVHGGMTYLQSTIQGATQQINNPNVTFTEGPNVLIWFPSFKTGINFYF
jgi:hypothetical protein